MVINMDLKNLNNISSSKYEIYTKLLDLAAAGEYTSTQNDFSNTDFLKASLFGYVTESLAMIMRDSAFHKTMIYKELFLNTAVMPESIYNWAKIFDIDCIDAVPSSRYATFSINVENISAGIQNISNNIAEYQEKYGITESGNFIVLDKSNPIIAGDYYFSLEHSIEIYQNNRGAYIVKYCLNEKNVTTNYGTYNSPIITSEYQTINGSTYLVFRAKIFQYKVVESTKIISSSSFLDVRNHQFTYSGQLCGLSLSYSKGNTTENVILKFSNMETDDSTETEKVAYYSLVDENTIDINFASNKVGGLPQAGGSLTLKTFITDGSSGNINFTGDAVFLISQDDFKVLSVSVKLDSLIITSGIDQSSLQNIKNTIRNKLSLRNTIITESDLNIWFETQSQLLENVNNSLITFRKEKDNILKRTFSAYLLLRDGVQLSEYLNGNAESQSTAPKASSSYLSSVVPTNTVDVVVNIDPDNLYSTDENGTITLNNFIIDPSHDITYNANVQQYIYNGVGNLDTDFIYNSPFFVLVDTQYNLVSYFYIETSSSSALNFYNINEMSNVSLVPLNVEVSHDHSTSSSGNYSGTYYFKFYFNSDTPLENLNINTLELSFNQVKVSFDPTQFKFKKVNNDESDETESETSNYVLEFEANLGTGLDNNLISLFEIGSSENARIHVTFENVNQSSGSITLTETTPIRLSISTTTAENDSTFDISVESETDLQIFSSLGDVMSSDIIVGRDANNKITSYTIKEVPVVAKYWFNSAINKEWFIKQLFVFINMLKENSTKLETTTFFNIKFRNSYGISRYYNSLTSNIRLKLTIYLKSDAINSYTGTISNADSVEEALENEIRDFIRVLVDQSNNEGNIVLSKIIMKVQSSYYDYIDHIDFNGLNGTFNQYIKQIDTTDNNYPLEYINLDNTSENNTNYILVEDIVFEKV